MKLIRVGVDLAKDVFQVHGVDRAERSVWRRRLRRDDWIQVLTERVEPGCEVGMEAYGGAHHWARELQKLGYRVKLIAPQFVKPYVKSNKNDANDAEAICEAMARPGMRFVPVKTLEQQDVQAMHRVRSGLVEQRTAKASQIRGLVAEYGLVVPRELVQLRRALPRWLEDQANGLSGAFRRLLEGLRNDLALLDDRVKELDREIEQLAQSDPAARRLMQLRGVGPHRHRARCHHWQRSAVCQRAADVGGSWPHATSAELRRQGTACLASVNGATSTFARCSFTERVL